MGCSLDCSNTNPYTQICQICSGPYCNANQGIKNFFLITLFNLFLDLILMSKKDEIPNDCIDKNTTQESTNFSNTYNHQIELDTAILNLKNNNYNFDRDSIGMLLKIILIIKKIKTKN